MTGWDEWAKYHATLFALHSDADAASIFAWVDLFADHGFTPDDLQAASRWIAMNNPPRFRNDHLAALSERLRAQKREKKEEEIAESKRQTALAEREIDDFEETKRIWQEAKKLGRIWTTNR